MLCGQAVGNTFCMGDTGGKLKKIKKNLVLLLIFLLKLFFYHSLCLSIGRSIGLSVCMSLFLCILSINTITKLLLDKKTKCLLKFLPHLTEKKAYDGFYWNSFALNVVFIPRNYLVNVGFLFQTYGFYRTFYRIHNFFTLILPHLKIIVFALNGIFTY